MRHKVIRATTTLFVVCCFHDLARADDPLPADVMREIHSAKLWDTIDIKRNTTWVSNTRILRTKELNFEGPSTLQFGIGAFEARGSASQAPPIIIVAGEITLHDGTLPAVISRVSDRAIIEKFSLNGVDRKTAARGLPDFGLYEFSDDGSNGARSGGNGHNGANGGDGKTYEGPDLYIFVGAIRGLEKPGTEKGPLLKVVFPGVAGGNGGHGGSGGPGGRGAHGDDGGPAGFFNEGCKGGLPGGRGGRGGIGGQAGSGGNGGHGTQVVIYGAQDDLKLAEEVMSFDISGGQRGIQGQPGDPGMPGEPGESGMPHDVCGGGAPQAPTPKPNPPNFGEGWDGYKGADGRALFREWAGVADLLN